WILESAHAKNQRVAVFTGPVFREDDPIFVTRDEMRVPVPLEYWKVIAMLNHEGELTATSYLLSQEDLIADMVEAPKEPKSFQVPVRMIERLTKLNFHGLAEHDPFVSRQEATGVEMLELASYEDIVLS
ncbi:MAG: DNA/RNA non-specific endonuclease, partial [Verrucomicrobia subdivision 3 bacterium]|nr:DNA/RNA non-specific endonuclease [Limisphaerales bacterium]